MTDTLRQGIDKAVEFNKTFFHGIYIEVKLNGSRCGSTLRQSNISCWDISNEK